MEIDTPIQFVKGVGPKLGDAFRRRGITTVGDLLEWYPRGYEDRRAARNIASLKAGEVVSLKAYVISIGSRPLGRTQKRIYEVVVGDPSGRISCKFFRLPYRTYFERFQPKMLVRIVGKLSYYGSKLEFNHPEIRDIDPNEKEDDALIPIYTETEGLSPGRLSKVLNQVIQDSDNALIPEYLPEWIKTKYNLPSRIESLKSLHQPPSTAGVEYLHFRSQYHRRLIFEEFFWFEFYLAYGRSKIKSQQAPALIKDAGTQDQIKRQLSFHLTMAQESCLEEIMTDLKHPVPMHRLIQGDVGCGKTIVALLAASFVIDNGYQVSLMAPTEILAGQHYSLAKTLFEPLGIEVSLLSGQLSPSEKELRRQSLQSGNIKLCIGTHALIQDGVDFKNLGLVIIDEQHRFGVHQREKLKSKGLSPHFLVMTATPIPRTLAMTVYGDMDVSIINELPKGRAPITTRVVSENKRPKVIEFLSDQIKKGRQAYIVYPLVEESEKMDLKDALTAHQNWTQRLPHSRIGLLYGKMKKEEKERVMEDFRKGEIQILIATTVIEVGVDVPNANLMIVEHSERFGLSQLHQLRGRVGRGSHKSFCVFMLGQQISQESRTRTEILAQTADGFKIAEADLEIRGPGEFLGVRQSGLTGFKLAHLVRDAELLSQARDAAFELVKRDPHLSNKAHQQLRQTLKNEPKGRFPRWNGA